MANEKTRRYSKPARKPRAPRSSTAAPRPIAPHLTPNPARDEEIAALRQEVERLTARAAEVEEAAKAKAQFLATVSHEIRTPMNGILGMSNLLVESNLNRDQRAFADVIVTSAKSLLLVVDEVLDLSKIEAGKLEIETIDFDLRLSIDQAAALLAPRAEAKRLSLVCRVNHDVPSRLRGDPGRLRQVLLNLAGNAIKFTDRGEVGINVERVDETNSKVVLRFSVMDTGIGMTPEQMARLFQTYGQVDASISRRYGGTGLGLAITKNLVSLMGGEIGVSSSASAGTTFWFQLPLEKQITPAASSRAMDALRGLRVLVADPAQTGRRSLIELLKGWECEVAEAETANAAVASMRAAAAASAAFTVVLVDMHMPDMEGEAFGRLVRADRALDGARLVMLTSLGRRGDAARARAAGYSAYLIKPVQQVHLFEALHELVSEVPEDGQVAWCGAELITRHSIEDKRRQRVRILIAEDDRVSQLVALAALERAGYAADVVSTGAEAIEAFERERFALVFMDGNLPDMDGMSLAKELRRRETGTKRRVPIIAMTAMVGPGERAKFIAAGMDDYIPKPIDLDTLARTVEHWATGDAPAPEAAAARDETKVAALPTAHHARPSDEADLPPAEESPAAEAPRSPASAAGSAARRGEILAIPTPDGLILDREQLEESCMGNAALRRTLVQLFLADVRVRMARLAERIAASDAHGIALEAHALRGASVTVGGVRCAELFGRLETAGHDADFTRTQELLTHAQAEVGRLEGVLAPIVSAA